MLCKKTQLLGESSTAAREKNIYITHVNVGLKREMLTFLYCVIRHFMYYFIRRYMDIESNPVPLPVTITYLT